MELRETAKFLNISAINFQAKSSLNEANVHWGGISINGQQGATAGFILDMTNPNATNLAQVVQRLLTMYHAKQTIG